MIRNSWIPLNEQSAWKDALEGIPHAFGHTWESCHAMSLSTGHNTYLYTFEADGVSIVCPIAERSFHGHIDILTPYGFSGFTGNGSCLDFTRQWKQEAARRNYVCGYIGLNPILHNPDYYAPEDAYTYNCIYAIDLQLEIEELFARLSKNRKRQLRSTDKSSTINFDQERILSFILRHYSDFYQRKGASAVYQFLPETIEELATRDCVILFGAEGENGIEEVMMLAFTPFVGEYLMSISNNDASRHTVNLLWKAIHLLKDRGVRWFNLGGGIRPGDGVAQFKERFGGQVFPLQSLKQIYNTEIYANLCKQTHKDPEDLKGYFPPYHA